MGRAGEENKLLSGIAIAVSTTRSIAVSSLSAEYIKAELGSLIPATLYGLRCDLDSTWK
jgi:hypothetical protein